MEYTMEEWGGLCESGRAAPVEEGAEGQNGAPWLVDGVYGLVWDSEEYDEDDPASAAVVFRPEE